MAILRRSTGLRNAIADQMAVISDSGLTGTNLNFDKTTNPDEITDSGNGFINDAGIQVGDVIWLTRCTTAANDGAYTVLSVAAGTITVANDSIDTSEAGGASTKLLVARGGALRDIFRGGTMHIYNQNMPADADTTEGATCLVKLTNGGSTFTGSGDYENGLFFGEVSSFVIGILSGQTWTGTGLADGTAAWFRMYDNAYTTGASTTAVRMDGDINLAGAALEVNNTTVTTGQPYSLQSANLTIPAA